MVDFKQQIELELVFTLKVKNNRLGRTIRGGVKTGGDKARGVL